MTAEDYTEKSMELAGWPVKVTSYKLGDVYRATVDNVNPGAWVSRGEGPTKAEAEKEAIETAERRLSRTKVHQVD